MIRVLPALSTTDPDPVLLHYTQLGHLPKRQIYFLKTNLLLHGGENGQPGKSLSEDKGETSGWQCGCPWKGDLLAFRTTDLLL